MSTDFIQVLTDLNGGRALLECGQQLGELLACIQERGGKGKLTLTLAVDTKVAEKGVVSQIAITPTVQISKPKTSPRPSTFYFTPTGDLTRSDPDQQELDFNERQEARK